jgi:hypothetical protein
MSRFTCYPFAPVGGRTPRHTVKPNSAIERGKISPYVRGEPRRIKSAACDALPRDASPSECTEQTSHQTPTAAPFESGYLSNALQLHKRRGEMCYRTRNFSCFVLCVSEVRSASFLGKCRKTTKSKITRISLGQYSTSEWVNFAQSILDQRMGYIRTYKLIIT